MAALAKALQITLAEQLHIATVRYDVVHLGCPDTVPTLSAFAAERFAGQLSVPAALPAIAWVGVQVMPGG